MQSTPASILPFDRAPQNARRESADRGFADLLAREKPAAKPDRPRAAAAKAEQHEPPADSDARSKPIADKPAAGEEPADARPSSRDTAVADAAADPAEVQKPDADPALDVAAVVVETAPAVPQSAIATAPDAAQPAAAPDTPVAEVTEIAPTAPMTGTDKVGPATAAGATVPDIGDGTNVVTAGKAPAETQPAMQMPGDETAARSLKDIATVQPIVSEQVEAAVPAAAAAAPRPTGAARDDGGAASPNGAASPATPTPGVGNGADADPSGGMSQEGDATPAAAGDRTTGQNKGQDAAIRSAAAQEATPAQATGARAGSSEILTAGSETGQRPDAPAPAQGHAAPPATSFANELRIATGAMPSADAATRMPSGPVVNQMAVQISRAVNEGQEKLTIDLRPAVLGRVSVSLELGHDHRVIAVISADRAETLDLLQRDVRGLERALQDAGLKTDAGSLSFNLNGDGARKSPFSDGAAAEQLVAAQPSDDEGDTPAIPINPYARVLGPTGVDIHV